MSCLGNECITVNRFSFVVFIISLLITLKLFESFLKQSCSQEMAQTCLSLSDRSSCLIPQYIREALFLLALLKGFLIELWSTLWALVPKCQQLELLWVPRVVCLPRPILVSSLSYPLPPTQVPSSLCSSVKESSILAVDIGLEKSFSFFSFPTPFFPPQSN